MMVLLPPLLVGETTLPPANLQDLKAEAEILLIPWKPAQVNLTESPLQTVRVFVPAFQVRPAGATALAGIDQETGITAAKSRFYNLLYEYEELGYCISCVPAASAEWKEVSSSMAKITSAVHL